MRRIENLIRLREIRTLIYTFVVRSCLEELFSQSMIKKSGIVVTDLHKLRREEQNVLLTQSKKQLVFPVQSCLHFVFDG